MNLLNIVVREDTIFGCNDDQISDWVHGTADNGICSLELVGDRRLTWLFVFVDEGMSILGASYESDVLIEVDEIDSCDSLVVARDLGQALNFMHFIVVPFWRPYRTTKCHHQHIPPIPRDRVLCARPVLQVSPPTMWT